MIPTMISGNSYAVTSASVSGAGAVVCHRRRTPCASNSTTRSTSGKTTNVTSEWHEIGEFSRHGEKWSKFFEMNLRKQK